MFNPVATYRFQFHSKFTFSEFENIIGYLKDLGVSTVYASPVFEAVPGSTHGYDGVNPHRINPEIGTDAQLRQINARLKEQGISWLQDIVPNHMGYSQQNPWLMDVLEKGRLSAFATFFDAAWTSPLFSDERIMVPFLGNSLEQVIQGGELTLAYQDGGLWFKYYDSIWPVSPKSYQRILGGGKSKYNQSFATALTDVLQNTGANDFSDQWDNFKQTLSSFAGPKSGKDFINKALNSVNNNPDLLSEIANEQVYRLCSYEETDSRINFRRFFTVNSLICLNIQDEGVFRVFHEYIRELTGQGIFQGLRIDHIDGLHDPEQYLTRLRELAGPETYIVTEKILEQGEDMPRQWPVQGNTGYDYLAQVNNLFTNKDALKPFTKFYQQLVKSDAPVEEQILQKKAYILKEHMGGEQENLYQLFLKFKLADKKALSALAPGQLKEAIGQLLIHCPVYRYYGNRMPLPRADEDAFKNLLHQASRAHRDLSPAFDLLHDLLLRKPQHANTDYNKRALQFYQRLMQFSGPLMAKGVEDTLMYTYNRFIGHNEVGDAPQAFGISIKEYHRLMEQRQQHWPLSINGSSTHDTKRGEDVRARLNVLTDIPDEWLKAVQQWQQLNAGLKQDNAPDANDEYFIYQTLTGVYAMPGQDEDDIASRLPEYLTKALREAKTNTNWTSPNETYENATLNFAKALLNKESEFWKSFTQFRQKVVDYGIINSLSQVLLKFTSPGVPDVYQGCELWDLSMVDPDNRRPVDYRLRETMLREISESQEPGELLNQLWSNRYTGQIKLWLTQLLFKQRSASVDVFTNGHYVPLKVTGEYAGHVIAFARHYRAAWYVTVAPLNLAALAAEQNCAPEQLDWRNTCIQLPDNAPAHWQQLLTGTEGSAQNNELQVGKLFSTLPLALLKLELPQNSRSAGILMHITSLPSAYGVGDIGPEAYKFTRFLSHSGQKIWQLLPLSPVSPDQGYSPYSSVCSMAGNVLLISPELLADEGLLRTDELKNHELPLTSCADYLKALKAKDELFEIAYRRFHQNPPAGMQQDFEEFSRQESYWLNDYADYTVLRKLHNDQPWHQWPDEFKFRKTAALSRFARANHAEINKVKWMQFIFIRQWHRLRAYCRSYNIQLFGDLPFYVSYDSADVWANKQFFSLDKQGNMTGMAGVPPDYFDADGQLWGMPVYKWEALKADGYSWWISRLRKNMELFDLLRLDHFRAFANYWDVPAGEKTARNGQWKQGPGSDFFKAIKQALGQLPFVAEDLGDINEAVFNLRDEFNFPGMKVLQFAFGGDEPTSIYSPHNYTSNFFAYTGTHDNNTTLGWYNQDASKEMKEQIAQYTGNKVSGKKIAQILGRIAYSSVAQTAILPLQDVLGLDEHSRMNNPASKEGNWAWRLPVKRIKNKYSKRLLRWSKLFNRW